jgi:integrase
MNIIDQAGTAGKYEYLFVNRRTGKPYRCIKHAWQKIKTAAGLPHYRVHDLRHEFASLLLGQGVSVLLVKELLGHAQINTTVNRYAHLATDELMSASSHVSDAINSAMPESN